MSETQNGIILRMLRANPEGITSLDALRVAGSFRLAARIADLKAEGHDIRSEMVSINGKRVARYRLTEQRVLW